MPGARSGGGERAAADPQLAGEAGRSPRQKGKSSTLSGGAFPAPRLSGVAFKRGLVLPAQPSPIAGRDGVRQSPNNFVEDVRGCPACVYGRLAPQDPTAASMRSPIRGLVREPLGLSQMERELATPIVDGEEVLGVQPTPVVGGGQFSAVWLRAAPRGPWRPTQVKPVEVRLPAATPRVKSMRVKAPQAVSRIVGGCRVENGQIHTLCPRPTKVRPVARRVRHLWGPERVPLVMRMFIVEGWSAYSCFDPRPQPRRPAWVWELRKALVVRFGKSRKGRAPRRARSKREMTPGSPPKASFAEGGQRKAAGPKVVRSTLGKRADGVKRARREPEVPSIGDILKGCVQREAEHLKIDLSPVAAAPLYVQKAYIAGVSLKVADPLGFAMASKPYSLVPVIFGRERRVRQRLVDRGIQVESVLERDTAKLKPRPMKRACKPDLINRWSLLPREEVEVEPPIPDPDGPQVTSQQKRFHREDWERVCREAIKANKGRKCGSEDEHVAHGFWSRKGTQSHERSEPKILSWARGVFHPRVEAKLTPAEEELVRKILNLPQGTAVDLESVLASSEPTLGTMLKDFKFSWDKFLGCLSNLQGTLVDMCREQQTGFSPARIHRMLRHVGGLVDRATEAAKASHRPGVLGLLLGVVSAPFGGLASLLGLTAWGGVLHCSMHKAEFSRLRAKVMSRALERRSTWEAIKWLAGFVVIVAIIAAFGGVRSALAVLIGGVCLSRWSEAHAAGGDAGTDSHLRLAWVVVYHIFRKLGGSGCHYLVKDFMSDAKLLGAEAEVRSSVSELGTWLMRIAGQAVRWLGERLQEVAPSVFSDGVARFGRGVIDKADKLALFGARGRIARFVERARVLVSPESDLSRVKGRSEVIDWAAECDVVIDEGRDIATLLAYRSSNGSLITAVRYWVDKLVAERERRKAETSGCGFRVEPTVIWLAGPPGVGKTTLATPLAHRLVARRVDLAALACEDLPCEGSLAVRDARRESQRVCSAGVRTYLSNEAVWYRSGTDKFWTGYSGQIAMVWDECASEAPASRLQGRPTEGHQAFQADFLQLVSTGAFKPQMADVGDKGKPVHPDFVVCSTNVLNVWSSGDADAIARRQHLPVLTYRDEVGRLRLFVPREVFVPELSEPRVVDCLRGAQQASCPVRVVGLPCSVRNAGRDTTADLDTGCRCYGVADVDIREVVRLETELGYPRCWHRFSSDVFSRFRALWREVSKGDLLDMAWRMHLSQQMNRLALRPWDSDLDWGDDLGDPDEWVGDLQSRRGLTVERWVPSIHADGVDGRVLTGSRNPCCAAGGQPGGHPSEAHASVSGGDESPDDEDSIAPAGWISSDKVDLRAGRYEPLSSRDLAVELLVAWARYVARFKVFRDSVQCPGGWTVPLAVLGCQRFDDALALVDPAVRERVLIVINSVGLGVAFRYLPLVRATYYSGLVSTGDTVVASSRYTAAYYSGEMSDYLAMRGVDTRVLSFLRDAQVADFVEVEFGAGNDSKVVKVSSQTELGSESISLSWEDLELVREMEPDVSAALETHLIVETSLARWPDVPSVDLEDLLGSEEVLFSAPTQGEVDPFDCGRALALSFEGDRRARRIRRVLQVVGAIVAIGVAVGAIVGGIRWFRSRGQAHCKCRRCRRNECAGSECGFDDRKYTVRDGLDTSIWGFGSRNREIPRPVCEEEEPEGVILEIPAKHTVEAGFDHWKFTSKALARVKETNPVVADAVIQASVRVTYHGDKLNSEMYGLIVHGDWLCCPAHLVPAADRGKASLTFSVVSNAWQMRDTVVRRSDIVFPGDRTDTLGRHRDLMFMRLRNWPLGKSVLKYIGNTPVHQGDTISVLASKRTKVTLDGKTSELPTLVLVRGVVSKVGELRYSTQDGGVRYPGFSTGATALWYGDCGAVALLGDRIVGLHVAGSASASDFCLFNPEEVRSICEESVARSEMSSEVTSVGPVVGRIHFDAFSRLPKSSIRPSSIASQLEEEVGPGLKGPAALTEEAFQLSISKFRRDLPPGADLSGALAYLTRRVGFGDLKSIATYEEAASGLQDGARIGKPVELNTSAGLPWVDMGLTKGDLYEVAGGGLLKPSPQLMEEVQRYEDRIRDGQVDSALCFAQIKDELRTWDRVHEQKTRLFIANPCHVNLVFRRWLLPFIAFFKARRDELFHAVGVNPFSCDWAHIASKAQGRRCLALDYSRFDVTHPRWVVTQCFDWVASHYGDPEDRRMVRNLGEALANFSYYWRNSVIQAGGGQPSGSQVTTVLNSLINVSLWLRAWQDAGNSFEEWGMHCDLVTFGDDCILFADDWAQSHFSGSQVQDLMARYGYTVTDPRHNIGALEYVSILNVEFLGRSFVREYSDVWLPRRDLALVWTSLMWVNQDETEEYVLGRLRAVLPELAVQAKPGDALETLRRVVQSSPIWGSTFLKMDLGAQLNEVRRVLAAGGRWSIVEGQSISSADLSGEDRQPQWWPGLTPVAFGPGAI